jgi:Ankyrin repeats (3 copies)
LSATKPATLELFAAEIPKSIFSCGLLDDEGCAECERCPLVLPYYQYRVLHAPIDTLNKAPHAFRVIIKTADLLCQKNDVLAPDRGTRQNYIKSLCKLALAFRPIRLRWNDDGPPCDWDKNIYEDEAATHLFVAAVYTNSDSLVRQMIDPIAERPDARVFSSVFGSAYSAASQQGNRELLLLLLERLYDPNIRWHFSARSQAAIFAVQRGHLDAGSLFLSTDSTKWSHWRYTLPQEPGRYTREEYECLFKMLNTPNLDLFCCSMEFLQNTIVKGTLPWNIPDRLFFVHSARGYVEMVKHLIEKLDFLPQREAVCRTVYFACRNGHIDMVKLLLPYVDTVPSDAMAYAAAGGHLDIIRMLATDDRFDINAQARKYPPPIVSAVQLEHIPMFRFLRERGASLDTPQCGRQAVSIAKGAGLDSMLEILAEEGVRIDGVAPSSRGFDYRCVCLSCRPWGSPVELSDDEEFDEKSDEEPHEEDV